jgi:phosphatidate cytidylyltransferase
MKKRFLTASVLVLIFAPLLYFKELFLLFQILMMVLSIIASYELIKMFERKKKFPAFSKYIVMGLSVLMNLSALAEWSSKGSQEVEGTISIAILNTLNINVGVLPMLVVILLVLFLMLVFFKEFDGADVGKSLLVICYAGLGFAALTILRSQGLRFIIYLFLITTFTDMFAYFIGSLIGKHKMCPLISPHKTWEGAIGGTIVATVCATCIGFFYGPWFQNFFNLPEGSQTIFHNLPEPAFISMDRFTRVGQLIIIALISLLTSIAGSIGDLVASKLKRTYEIKDYGNIFPGHGGVLDRLDSALFAAMFLLSAFTFIRGLGLV